jgi:hypothetical protein
MRPCLARLRRSAREVASGGTRSDCRAIQPRPPSVPATRENWRLPGPDLHYLPIVSFTGGTTGNEVSQAGEAITRKPLLWPVASGRLLPR